jgi:hypothetical protein
VAAVPADAAAPVPTGSWVGLTTLALENLDRPYTTKFVVTLTGTGDVFRHSAGLIRQLDREY